ncbi:MAG: chemotaxis protein CheW [Clostridia bacterium]|nr:chemotaxis protein CheW [Clostridia bacterium]
MKRNLISGDTADFPSLTFRVGGHFCSISARHVSGIMLMPDVVTPIPQVPAYCLGMVDIRGYVVPLVDLRTLFGLPTLDSQYTDFCAMIDSYKADHEKWVNTLRECIVTKAPFPLSADAHGCRLGKWFDTYAPANQSVASQLKKLEEPHERFHESAALYEKYLADPNGDVTLARVKTFFDRSATLYKPEILKILEDTKESFLREYQSILIILEQDGETTLSFIVDSVDAVETITRVPQAQEGGFWQNSQFVIGIGRGERNTSNILMLDDAALAALAEHITL